MCVSEMYVSVYFKTIFYTFQTNAIQKFDYIFIINFKF